jgi:hypothetical protein
MRALSITNKHANIRLGQQRKTNVQLSAISMVLDFYRDRKRKFRLNSTPHPSSERIPTMNQA